MNADNDRKASVWRRFGKVLLGIGLALGVAVIVAWWTIGPGLLFLLRYVDHSHEEEGALWAYSTHEVEIAGRPRSIPLRVYTPKNGYRRSMVVIHGVHGDGYDEERLIHFAKRMAESGYLIVTPDIHELKNFDIEPGVVDEIELIALWVADQYGGGQEQSDGKIGLSGISFAGGLALSAASRRSLRDKLSFVFAFGAHGHLGETLRYLSNSASDDPAGRPPHIYGQAVLARRYAMHLVPADQVNALRSILLIYLSSDFETVRSELDGLGEKSREIVQFALDRNVVGLGKLLSPLVDQDSFSAELSPVSGAVPACPVLLLHGHSDNVIPPTQTERLARWAQKSTRTESLISELIRHVEMQKTSHDKKLRDYYRLCRFWTKLLRI